MRAHVITFEVMEVEQISSNASRISLMRSRRKWVNIISVKAGFGRATYETFLEERERGWRMLVW